MKKSGRLTVVGIGPGAAEQMTFEAVRAMEESDVIIGYHVYVDLVRDMFPDKEMLSTPMRREAERCEMAIREAAAGKDVAFICSGDSGVYGMAGLLLEMTDKYEREQKAPLSQEERIEVRVIAGVTAALSGAARLGAPLIHDFAVISLSDLMTPRSLIEKRLRAAGEADFAVVIYNPSSRKRADYLARACDILLESRSPDTVCGTVRSIGREGETKEICTLKELRNRQVDMFTTVFIGNSSTRRIGGRMVTLRGYEAERE
ncbi:MAG: precorrin-3B C(17)-methyltransferase [Lachnospiraceae bacterium]|nr:precorrin-3B C(17)-methyltransferase [Lachnospiraceae bacterium]